MSKIKIAEMLKRGTVADTDLMICEDDIDTKQTTVKDIKRAFNGDTSDPSEYKFYSSQKVEDIKQELEMQMNMLPSVSDIESMKNIVNNLIKENAGNGEKDPEIIAARGTYETLGERLDSQESELSKLFIKNPKSYYYGSIIDLHDKTGVTTIITPDKYSEETTLYVQSVNRLSILPDLGMENVTAEHTGYKIKYTSTAYEYDIPVSLSPGSYTLYGTYMFSEGFEKSGFRFKLKYTDGTSTYLSFGFTGIYRFEIDKYVEAIALVPTKELIVDGMELTIHGMMVSEYGDLDRYTEFYDSEFTIPADSTDTITVQPLFNVIIYRSKGFISATVEESEYDINTLIDRIQAIEDKYLNEIDTCGLIEDKGTYIFADLLQEDSKNLCVISRDEDKSRNGNVSMKIQYMENNPDDHPRFTLPLQNTLNLEYNSTISIQLYIDKTTYTHFTEEDGLKVMLSSDYTLSNPAANYYFFNIGKDSFVQGWNTIRLKLDKFLPHGTPDLSAITQINFRLYSNDFTEGRCVWLNSVIIDQKMKPVVLFAFDDFDEEGFDYGYPYLTSRNIPATIFANNKRTLTKDYINKVCDLLYTYDWEVGCNGINPNKEYMTQDDNPSQQYQGLRNTRSWLINNFQDNIVSYSAPYGDLRPISVKILRSMGFKIGKASADNFCSFFGKDDFTIPMHLLSNEEGHGADDICDKLDTIVDTGQVLCIHTAGVSRYGNEIQANKVSFEKVIDKIEEYREQGRLECMTFQEFYRKCCE